MPPPPPSPPPAQAHISTPHNIKEHLGANAFTLKDASLHPVKDSLKQLYGNRMKTRRIK